ncbi:glycogen debranching N-terminal domain-containing protein [Staphylospora marina]|uniref:amylo-alpha-1,6-glucosidase n=1 Tax=Staphylospora marina TaxID=2490858 RepID=UPI000F5C223D|nr:glycogen debranching N-terminal domain-containing protein [Staphylospora marina]
MKQLIKDGEVFLFSDPEGTVPGGNAEGYGLWRRDMRHLSTLEWELEGVGLVTLSSEARGARGKTRYTNLEVKSGDEVLFWRESLEIIRERWIDGSVLHDRFRLTNLDRRQLRSHMVIRVDADFADMFTVRGFAGGKTGNKRQSECGHSSVRFVYEGVDGLVRRTSVSVDTDAETDEEGRFRIPVLLEPGESMSVTLSVVSSEGDESPEVLSPDESFLRVLRKEEQWRTSCPEAETDSVAFKGMLETALGDFRMLLTDAGDGELPVAGLPWFAVPFGRDSLIAAWQALPVRPELALAVIRTMARHQGSRLDPWRDEEPGKIMHEIRRGELANSGQVPFTPYYGSIDSTPLFLILMAEYWRFTGDFETIRTFADHARRAFEWMDRHGDPDGRGYTSYVRKSEKGIDNQGWKDSADSVVHKDGRLAEAPISLCEVQGYVYMARTRWAELFRLLGDEETANRLREQAEDLKRRFADDFWMEDESFVALALDKDRRKVGAVTSNPGHLLMTGILDPDKGARVGRRLLESDLFSGWGIRTMSDREKAYNPMSYHNGSVWPHDNSLILLGLLETGMTDEAARLMAGLIRSASCFGDYRLPELFCGYGENEGNPVPYPVACSPQAWAAGAAFVLLRAMAGMFPDPVRKQVELAPVLPEGVNRLLIRRLKVGEGELDLALVRSEAGVHVSVLRNTTGWSVLHRSVR